LIRKRKKKNPFSSPLIHGVTNSGYGHPDAKKMAQYFALSGLHAVAKRYRAMSLGAGPRSNFGGSGCGG
jgi:hypothetical protein